jgi:dihydrofolate reductase
MPLALIAAVAQNNCIGKKGALPWYLPEDLKRFKKITTGKVVLMGRKTWESLPPKFKPLPNRKNVVVSRQNVSVPAGVELYHTIDEALAAHLSEEIMVIGGGEIYNQTMDRAETLYITEVHNVVEGDVFFPIIDKAVWEETEREEHEGFSFVTYQKA